MTYYIKGGSKYNESNPKVWVGLFLGGFPDADYLLTDWKNLDDKGHETNDDPFWRMGGSAGGAKEFELGLWEDYRIKITTSGIFGWVGPGVDDFDSLGGGGATSLDGLNDVTISGTPADNEVLAYDNGSTNWINQTPAEAGLSLVGHTHTHVSTTGRTESDHHTKYTNANALSAVGMSAVRTFNGAVDMADNEINDISILKIRAAHGNGLWFWNGQSLYSIYMSDQTNATYGGRADATSDFNMYFNMTGGTNRGFQFCDGLLNPFFAITPDTGVFSTVPLNMGGQQITNVGNVDGVDVSGLCTEAEAHAYIEANALTMTQDITFNAGQLFDGKDVSGLCTEAEAVQAVEDAGLVLSATKVITSADEDLTFTFGRAQIDSRFSDYMAISHRDMPGNTEWALSQHKLGDTFLNAPTGKALYFNINNVFKMSMSVNSLTMGVPIAMGANNITFTTGLVDGVDVSDKDANSIKGVTVDDTDIANNKILKYNSTSGNLEYEIDDTGAGFAPPIGFITMFSGSWTDNSTIPGWYKCDGNNGTPNLVDKFVRGATTSGGGGGSDDAIVVEHNHGASAEAVGNHTHGIALYGSGTPAFLILRNGAELNPLGPTSTAGGGGHGHNVTVNNEGVSGTDKNIPVFYALIFIMRIS